MIDRSAEPSWAGSRSLTTAYKTSTENYNFTDCSTYLGEIIAYTQNYTHTATEINVHAEPTDQTG